jgi:L-aminopeptidase/D-esterase-like protein
MHPTRIGKNPNAILFSGGSALGLRTADGVMRWHAERGLGHETPIRPIPLVPTSILYDLFINNGKVIPTPEMGYAACDAAILNNPAQGNVGAGAGAIVGKWNQAAQPMKGGFGVASDQVGELVVFAAAAVNAMGDVLAADGTTLAGSRQTDGRWTAETDPYRLFSFYRDSDPQMTNTTLVLVATNAQLSKLECHLLAQRAHDGYARAIAPVHTIHDGDTAYAVSTGTVAAHLEIVAAIGTVLVAEAIRNAVRHAQSVGDLPGLAG